MTHTPTPKALSHDEKKAADAAFTGHPFNEAWSASARAIYDGIVRALPRTDVAIPSLSNAEQPLEAPSTLSESVEPQEPLAQEQSTEQELLERATMPAATRDREAAIQ
ncbi:MAG TPA: hypothetical protein VJU54_12930, partial [Nitrospiraceae bacterium]|nr:hypothetical protein [Nitrospiraceae bacterium]